MPDVFDTAGVDLDQFLGTRNDTTGVVVEDKDLITHIKGILGPFVLRRLKSDVMRQLVPKIQQVLSHPLLFSYLGQTTLDALLIAFGKIPKKCFLCFL